MSVKIPPIVKPKAKPTDWPPPMLAKARFLVFPVKEFVTMLTALGKHIDIDIPQKPQNKINSPPVRASPQPKTKAVCRVQPRRYMNRLPRASDSDPDSSKVQPQVKAWIDTGLGHEASVRVLRTPDTDLTETYHNCKPSGICKSSIRSGSDTVMMPTKVEARAVAKVVRRTINKVLVVEVISSGLGVSLSSFSSATAETRMTSFDRRVEEVPAGVHVSSSSDVCDMLQRLDDFVHEESGKIC